MEKHFGAANWREYVPVPVCSAHPEYLDFYYKAWELAFAHIKSIPGMPQDPYMDEAFCATQLWIWDSCFMSLFCKYAPSIFPGVETLQNFYSVLHGGKHLPKILPPENEPEWVGATPGVPYEIQVHIADNPPLFAWAELENVRLTGDVAHVRELLDSGVLQRHYHWIEKLHGESNAAENGDPEQFRHRNLELFRPLQTTLRGTEKPSTVYAPICLRAEKCGYLWEGGRSGMDNTPRGRIGEHAEMARPNNPDMLWLDALCQQALAARSIAKLYAIVGEHGQEAIWNAAYDEKKALVESLYWDETDGIYYDIDRNTHAFCRVPTIASYWPLTAEIASPERARRMADLLADPTMFGGDVPLVSLARSDSDFSPTGKYWRGGVWLPTAYAALRGLVQYGMLEEARSASKKLLAHMYKTYVEFEPHTIWETYSSTEPKPATCADDHELARGDFCGWSALGPISVYLEMVLGFHTIDALTRTIKWARPTDLGDLVGVKNLHVGDIVTDIILHGSECTVRSSAPYTLEIDGVAYEIPAGDTRISL